jgi:1,2-dihydroxy-3-keto-5-methylthiopentene dioxygenase
MTQLRVFSDQAAGDMQVLTDQFSAIHAQLAKVGIRLQRWKADAPISAHSSSEDILQAYKSEIDQLVAEGGYQTWDVVSMHPAHPDKTLFREKFLAEHTHGEDEVRFFVRGCGLFSLHIQDHVYEVLCTQGDLISVPAGTRHWFDMGPNPEFTAIRLFNNPEGWVAQFTGSAIAQNYARLDN